MGNEDRRLWGVKGRKSQVLLQRSRVENKHSLPLLAAPSSQLQGEWNLKLSLSRWYVESMIWGAQPFNQGKALIQLLYLVLNVSVIGSPTEGSPLNEEIHLRDYPEVSLPLIMTL